MSNSPSFERRAVASLASLYIFRMLGLFMVLPVLVVLGGDYQGATPALLGLALGVYGLTQALLQLPLGLLSDFVGRKPVIVGGLLVFAAGSVIAALANSIEWLIVGRALQGAGAIAAAIMALLTDLTAEQNRTKAMASVGASIGVAFALSLVLGPLLGAHWGLAGLFWVTAGLAVVGVAVALFVVPSPQAHAAPITDLTVSERMSKVLGQGQLLRLDFGVFILHLLMTAIFVAIPGLLLNKLDVAIKNHWLIYLPVMLIAFCAMVPMIILAEKRRRMKQVFLIAIGALVVSLACLALLPERLWLVIAILLVFFWGFNLLEATLPSLMSKLAPVGTKGAASGVYSTCQFLGAFTGGVVGGLVLQNAGMVWIFSLGAVLAGIWFVVGASMVVPKPTSQVLVALDDRPYGPLVAQLKAIDGVVDAIYIADLKSVSLRVDSDRFQRSELQALGLS